MMKKLTALLMAIVMTIAMAVTTAFATAKQIPDLANCFPDDITFIQEDAANGIRVYAADDAEVLMNDVAEYLGILCADYGFGGIETDFESSDSFVYVYLTEYSGDATPEYIDSCPEEAYVLVGMTGSGDQYIAMVVAVEGIEISDSEMSAASGMDAYDFAALPDPGLFIGAERQEDYEHRTNDTPMVSYLFEMTEDGESAAFSYMEFIMEEYGYELVHTYEKDYINVTGDIFMEFYFEYTGPYSVSIIPYDETFDDPEFSGTWNLNIGLLYDFVEGTILMTVYFAPDISLVDSGMHTSYEIVDMNGSGGGGGGDIDWDDGDGSTEEKCIICDGTGWRDCLTCNGSGYTGYGSDRHECPSFNCNGGKVSCTTCGGDGRK